MGVFYTKNKLKLKHSQCIAFFHNLFLKVGTILAQFYKAVRAQTIDI